MGGEPIRDFYATKILIGINVGLFIVELVAGMDAVIRQWGMYPAAVSIGGEWWRLFTAAFLHGGLLHIGFNMLVLWLVGRPLESVLGHTRFVILYLLSALGGSVASYTFSPLNTVSVGASGAIFGLMAALLVAGHSYSILYSLKQLKLEDVLGNCIRSVCSQYNNWYHIVVFTTPQLAVL